MSIVAPADKRFRRAHLKPATRPRGRSSSRRGLVLRLALATALATAAAFWQMPRGVPKLLRVEHIVVRGNQRLSSGEVLALLDGLRGESILTADLTTWRGQLLSSPWVSEASLRRLLPSTVEVSVAERTPLGIARLRNQLYLIDQRGGVIDEYGPNYGDLDLPIIDGLSPSHDAGAALDGSRAALARRLLDALQGQEWAGRLSQIDVTDPRNAIVLLEGDATLIRLGHERFAERLRSYLDLAPALRERVPEIDYVDLRFDERVYVRPLSGARKPSMGGAARGVTPSRRLGRGAETG